MDLLPTQCCYNYDDEPTQKIELDIEKEKNVQVGLLTINSNSYPIYKGINSIGRNPNSQIYLEHQSVSKCHAEIEGNIHPMNSWICDLESFNKTKLNNSFLLANRYYELKDNSKIQFGKVNAVYKSCHLGNESVIHETLEHSKQNNVKVVIPETPVSLTTSHLSDSNGDSSTTTQECPRKFTSQPGGEILKNKSIYNVNKEINRFSEKISIRASKQYDHSTSCESDDIFDAATQHVNIDSYLENNKDSSIQKETNSYENVDIDDTPTVKEICNKIGTSTPMKKTNLKSQIEKLNNIERDLVSKFERIQSKKSSSHAFRENNKEKENNIDDFDMLETQLVSLPNLVTNANKEPTLYFEGNDIDIDTLSTQIIDLKRSNRDVNNDKRYEDKDDIDLLDTQETSTESNNYSAIKSHSNIEDISYETASTQIIGEIEIMPKMIEKQATNDKTFKSAESNLQVNLQDEDDDILSRLPEVNISGTLSNPPISQSVKRTRSKRFSGNKKTPDKSNPSNNSKTKSIVKNVTGIKNLISPKDNDKSRHSMDNKINTKKNKVSATSLTNEIIVKEESKKHKGNIRKESVTNKSIRNNTRNTRSMTNVNSKKETKESETKVREESKRISKRNNKGNSSKTKDDNSSPEMGKESQEIVMIMSNSLITDNAPKNIRKRKIANTDLDDDSLNNSNVSRKGRKSNVQYEVSTSPVKRNKLSKNNTLQSSLDLTTDDSLNGKHESTSSSTRFTNKEKQINENNTNSYNKKTRKNKTNDVSMDIENNKRTSATRRKLSSLSPNTSFLKKERILFTGIMDDEYDKILKVLGGIKVNDPSTCTVLVTDKIRRTTKFLCGLAKAVPIVSVNWLHESKRAGHFLDQNNYMLKDPAMEAKYGFRLRKSLDKARERQLLDGYAVLLTPNIVSPPISELKTMITSCGGKAFLRAPSKLPVRTVIISHEDDLNSTQKWLTKAPKDVTVQSTEFLLTGILKQELDFDRYKLM